ncbi:MAG TPA: large conductance mechanosensitive channel protein MscL [Armatimonadota bacterium]|jgi:large conductance mechanosensitive channel
MFREFRDFIARGNVLDLAIAVLIGAAFGKIVTSFTQDILTPLIGAVGKVDFSNIYVALSGTHYATLAEAKAHNVATLNVGLFLNAVFDFLIVAWVLFLIVKAANKVRKPAEAPAAAPTKDCPFCLTAIPEAATRCPACTSQM